MDDLNQQALASLKALDRESSELLDLCHRHLTGADRNRPTQTLYVLAACRRLLAHTRAFKHSVNDRNSLVASALLRMQLDTVARLYALFWVADPEAFARSVRDGVLINKLKDRHKNVMHDSYLVSKLVSTYPWMQSVYESTSGVIHFSGRHMEAVLDVDDNGQIHAVIGSNDGDKPIGYYREVSAAFWHVTGIAKTAIADCFRRIEEAGTVGD